MSGIHYIIFSAYYYPIVQACFWKQSFFDFKEIRLAIQSTNRKTDLALHSTNWKTKDIPICPNWSSTSDGIRVFLLVFSGSINWWDFPLFDYTFLEKCQNQGEIVSHNIKTSDKICSVFGGTLIEWKNPWGISKQNTHTCQHSIFQNVWQSLIFLKSLILHHF